MKTKRCTKCGEEKPLEMFLKNAQRLSGRGAQCKECAHQVQRRSSRKWREQMKKNHPEEYKLLCKLSSTKSYHKNVQKRKEYHKQRRDNLDSEYVKVALCQGRNLHAIDIPDDLVIRKREQMELVRVLKKLKAIVVIQEKYAESKKVKAHGSESTTLLLQKRKQS